MDEHNGDLTQTQTAEVAGLLGGLKRDEIQRVHERVADVEGDVAHAHGLIADVQHVVGKLTSTEEDAAHWFDQWQAAERRHFWTATALAFLAGAAVAVAGLAASGKLPL